MPEDITRRRLLRASAATATGLGAIGTATAATDATDVTDATDDLDLERIPMREFGPDDLRTETLAPASVPEEASGIRPGSQIFVEYPDGTTAGCSANFVWRDTGGAGDSGDSNGGIGSGNSTEFVDLPGSGADDGEGDLYIGAAGHCFLPDDANASENARREGESDDDVFDVSQLSVEICVDCAFGGVTGPSFVEGETVALGEVAYARQSSPDGTELGNDFGVVRIPEEVVELVDPSLPQWGGPDGVSEGAVPEGEPVNQYGAGAGNGEVYLTQGSSGVSLGDLGTPESWHAAIRASPGDSGSPLVATDLEGLLPEGAAAAGVLTHLSAYGTTGTTMGRCLEMPLEDGVDLDLEVVEVGDL